MAAYTEEQRFDNIDFTTTALASGNYEACTFTNCNFAGLDIGEINFIDCDFNSCNFSNCKTNKTGLRDFYVLRIVNS